MAEMNEKMLDCAHYTYIMQIVNIHKQAELKKKNGLDSSIVYRIKCSWAKDMQPFIFASDKWEQAQSSILFIYIYIYIYIYTYTVGLVS